MTNLCDGLVVVAALAEELAEEHTNPMHVDGHLAKRNNTMLGQHVGAKLSHCQHLHRAE
jgi:hypothetical protein